MLKKIFSHSLIYSVGPQLPRLVNILVLPLITPFLSSTDYGVYGLVTAYLGVLGGLGDLGMAIVMVNTFYKHPAHWQIVWRQIHGYLFVWSFLFAILQALLLYFIIPKEVVFNLGYIILLNCLPTAFFNTTITFGSRYYQFSQKPTYIAVLTALTGTISIIINYVSIAIFHLGYMGWFLSSFITSAILFLFYLYPVFFKYKIHPLIAFKKKFIFKHLKVALPTIPHDYSAYLINTSDRIVFNVVGIDIAKQGNYNLAYTFGNYFEFFGNAVGMAIGPFYTKLFAKKTFKAKLDVRTMTFFFQVIFLTIGFLICLWCKELFLLLIKNNELSQAYPLAIIIIMGYVYRPMYWASANQLFFLEKTTQLWKISFIAGVLNIGLNFILVPVYGIKAAAITTFFALLYMGFSGFFLRVYKEEESPPYYPLLWLSGIIVLSGLVFLLRDIAIAYKIIISILYLISGFFLFMKFKRELKQLWA
ncbi:MAG: oligosaccharide flippase family protein [Chitinophagaceae bacterium]|nr:oligosaccharide flippase family protein [Chitinophagaceae bacterium]